MGRRNYTQGSRKTVVRANIWCESERGNRCYMMLNDAAAAAAEDAEDAVDVGDAEDEAQGKGFLIGYLNAMPFGR